MKKLLGCILLLAAAAAHAQQPTNAVRVVQTDSTGFEYNERFISPTPGTNCTIMMRGAADHEPVCTSPSISHPTRSLNTAFQVSATRLAHVKYAVQQTITASIAGGQNGDVVLEVASDSGFTANVQTIDVNGFGQTYTLAVALQGVQPQTTSVSGWVPAGYYVRIRSVNNTGTPSFSYRAGQEVLQ